MVLHVDFSHLIEEAKRHGLKPWVYLHTIGSKVVATVADPSSHMIVQSEARITIDEAKASAAEQGLLVHEGRWTPDPMSGEINVQEQIWVAAVAYKSTEERPGLWVHGYRGNPSAGDVLKDFFDEMSGETDLAGVSLDDFSEAVNPNIIVLGPNELAAFADASDQGR